MFNNLSLFIKFCIDFDARSFDQRSQHLFLANSPWAVIAISFGYLYIVKGMGPEWMRNREPFTLKYAMMIYNVIQVVANSLLTYKVFTVLNSNNKFSEWSCLVADRSNSDYALSLVHCMYCYFLLKILDLLETVFCVLRKHSHQVTFPHVYHHCGMLISIYLALRYGGQGQGVFLVFLNCLVNIIIYLYYFISVLQPDRKNSLWWKKYITQMQMIQYSMNMIHFSAAMLRKDCPEPKYLLLFLLMQNIYTMIVFGDFYINAYVERPKSK